MQKVSGLPGFSFVSSKELLSPSSDNQEHLFQYTNECISTSYLTTITYTWKLSVHTIKKLHRVRLHMQNLFLWVQRTNYSSAAYLPCTRFRLSILPRFLMVRPWIFQKPFPTLTWRQALQGQWSRRNISNAEEHLSFPATGHNLWKCSEQDSGITVDMIIVKIK